MTKVFDVHTWECKVALPQPNGGAPLPTVMTGQFANYLQARAYFSAFGKMLNEPRIIN